MAFWRVAGFAQPSPIEQILDKEEYTLEELLDEDDIIQECKSLNGRLIAFLREKKVVEQLLRYLVQPPSDPDDPKKQYKYPFTACEVFCCEVEAVFNALLEDEALLDLLFSLLDEDPPLSCKTAGYFGRVVGQLLLRKPNEMMQYLSNHDRLLEKMVRHVDVTSIADVIKRLAGADEQSSMVYMPMHTQWLVQTPLLDMLLERLGPGWPGDAVTNAADVLTAIANMQPSALSSKLMRPASLSALFERALEPGGDVIVPALEVCIALLRPWRGMLPPEVMGSGDMGGGGANGFDGGDSGGGGRSGGSGAPDGGSSPGSSSPLSAAAPASQQRAEALGAVLAYLPRLVSFLRASGGGGERAVQETPYGLLAPPLGRPRLKVVELLAVLLQVGGDRADEALMAAGAMALSLELFGRYPFNNLLHHQVFDMLEGVLQRASPPMVEHALGGCQLVRWFSGLPREVTPLPRPSAAPPKGPLRAGYLGHVTQVANLLVAAAAQKQAVADALAGDEAWQRFVLGELRQRNEVEDVSRWECGRPTSAEVGDLVGEGDEFQNEMDLEGMQGLQPALFHRYGVLDEGDEGDDGSDDDDDGGGGPGGVSGADGVVTVPSIGEGYSGGGGGTAYGAMLASAMQGMGISGDDGGGGSAAAEDDGVVLRDVVVERGVHGGATDSAEDAEGGAEQGSPDSWSLLVHPGPPDSAAPDAGGERGMEDDAVLLASSDEEEEEEGGAADSSGDGGQREPGPSGQEAAAAAGGGGGCDSSIDAAAAGPGDDDVVMVESPALLCGDEPGTSGGLEGMDSSASEGGPAGDAAGGGGAAGGGPSQQEEGDEGFTDHAMWSQLPTTTSRDL